MRTFRNPNKVNLSELKQAKSILFKLIRKAAFFRSLLTLSEHAFPFTQELFGGYETPSIATKQPFFEKAKPFWSQLSLTRGPILSQEKPSICVTHHVSRYRRHDLVGDPH